MHYTIFELDQYRNHVMSCHGFVAFSAGCTCSIVIVAGNA